jgi:Nucleotide modification associated domain 2
LLMNPPPTIYSYVVARDYGFAPNPFHGVCTLATCKPRIRKATAVGDWVIGTGSKGRKRAGFLVYAMKVEEALTFDQYWSDERFLLKRPNLHGSKKIAFGDNIYYRKGEGYDWKQLNSHHTLPDGRINKFNLNTDTSVNRVLISRTFTYWGGHGPAVPQQFRDYNGDDIVCAARNHRSNFAPDLVRDFLAWIEPMAHEGFVGEPLDWERTP